MKTAVCRIDLGVTRIAGYTLYDETTREFQETTPKEVRGLIYAGQVNGLKLSNEEIVLDTEGFNMQNLLVKSSVGKYRMLNPINNSLVSCTYAVVRMLKTESGNLYETVSNKCARVKVSTARLKMMMEIGYVAGARLVDGEIQLCKGVTLEDRSSGAAITNELEEAFANKQVQDPQPDENNEIANQNSVTDSTMEKLFESLNTEASSEAESTATAQLSGRRNKK